MSVNEVKLKKSTVPFEVRGTPTSSTFCIGDEDHTIGNTLRHILVHNSSVGFAGYSVPHPSEPVVQIRVQTTAAGGKQGSKEPPPTAISALKTACTTLSDQCDIVLDKLESLIPEVRDDRIRMEKILLEEGYADEEGQDEEEGDAMEGVDETLIKTEEPR